MNNKKRTGMYLMTAALAVVGVCFFVLYVLGGILFYKEVRNHYAQIRAYIDDDSVVVQEVHDTDVVEPVVVEPVVAILDTFAVMEDEMVEQKFTTDCLMRPMSVNSDAMMLVPVFLDNRQEMNNGGYMYQASNGAYLITTVGYSDTAPAQLLDDICSDYKQVYTRAKDNWAVNSGEIEDNMYYYTKAVTIDDIVYLAFFAAPKHDEVNGKVYTELTNIVFNSANFPKLDYRPE